MNKAEYFEFHETMCKKMMATTRQKNADYTGEGQDPFKNFKAIGIFSESWITIGFMTRMFDKFSRVASFIQKGILLVKDESVEDSLIDLSNYCILFAGYLKAKKQESLASNKPLKLHRR